MQPLHDEFNPYFNPPPPQQERPPPPSSQDSQQRPRLRFQQPQEGTPPLIIPQRPQHRQQGRQQRQERPQQNQEGPPPAPPLITPQRQHGRQQRQERPQQNQEGPSPAPPIITPQRQHGRQQRQERPQQNQEGPSPAPPLITPQRQHGRQQRQEDTPPPPLITPQRQYGSQEHQGGPSPAYPPQVPHHHQPTEHGSHTNQPGYKVTRTSRTKFLPWFIGVFCAILWIVIIVGGLAILIIYLVFRPKSPRFDIPEASLNAVYLDTGTLLNADVSLLANFTNPNRKVNVDLSYIVFRLYFHDTLIATGSSDPFSATKRESKLQSIHLVSSEVRLADNDIMLLRRELEQNRVTLEVRGLFRARSKLGNVLRYSYWLHSRCSINTTGPPSGVLVSRKCSTKR